MSFQNLSANYGPKKIKGTSKRETPNLTANYGPKKIEDPSKNATPNLWTQKIEGPSKREKLNLTAAHGTCFFKAKGKGNTKFDCHSWTKKF
jgi:hypothetical protein